MTAIDTQKPLCVCNKYKRRIKDNTVEPPVWGYDVSCGQCPQRRASDMESMNSDAAGYPLPTCVQCDARLMPAIGIMKPHADFMEQLYCLECVRTKKLSCEYGKHIGPRIVEERLSIKCAIPGSKHANSHIRYPKLACFKCYKHHKLESWIDYSIRMKSFDPITGEVKELVGETKEFTLTPAHIQYDPMAEYGGMGSCWCPTRGIEGTYRIVDGNRFSQWIAFMPRKFIHFKFREKNTRALSVIRYDPTSLNVENVAPSTLWHSGVNNWIDILYGTKDEPRAKNPSPLGWAYVRITGLNPGLESHALHTSRYSDVTREATANEARRPSIREWVEWCHGQ